MTLLRYETNAHGIDIMAKRKRRTREHVLEDLSENFLERLVLRRGYLLRRPARDYGIDVTMFHFSQNGEVENGEVRFQLKATERLQKVDDGRFISITIKTADLRYWALELFPFILVVHDAVATESYWLPVQQYVKDHSGNLNLDQHTVNLRIPISNRVTPSTIDLFRKMSLDTFKTP